MWAPGVPLRLVGHRRRSAGLYSENSVFSPQDNDEAKMAEDLGSVGSMARQAKTTTQRQGDPAGPITLAIDIGGG
jgi:hypothetical protein